VVRNNIPHFSLKRWLMNGLDPQLMSNIRSSTMLIPNVRELAVSRSVTPTSSAGGTPGSHRSQARSYQETETGDGQGEIQELARKILYTVDGDEKVDEKVRPASSRSSHVQPGSSVGRESNASGMDHEELRRSVRDALGGSTRGKYH
jgi:vacuolar protein 8